MLFIDKIKNAFIRNCMKLFSFFYRVVFQENMSEDVENFIKNLSYISLGTIFLAIFSFLFNVIAGRLLGPSGYGNFVLVQSIAMFLYIPMLLGLHTAMVKYCAENSDYNSRCKIISTTYITVITLTVISVILYSIFNEQLLLLFSVNPEIIELSVIFAIFFVLYTLTTSTMSGLHMMKEIALFQPIYGLTLVSSLFIFTCIQSPSFKSMIYSNYLAYGIIVCVIIFVYLKKFLILNIDRHWLSQLWRYSNLAIIGGIASTLYTNIDRILINYYMGAEFVGIYGVYYIASFSILGFFASTFALVFFPTASRKLNKRGLYHKLKKTFPYLFILGIPGALLGEFILLNFFGKEYPLEFPLMIIFAITAVLAMSYGIIASFFSSDGGSGIRIASLGVLIIAIINIVLNIIFIPRIGLYGAIGATAIALVLGLCYIFYYGGKYLSDRSIDRVE